MEWFPHALLNDDSIILAHYEAELKGGGDHSIKAPRCGDTRVKQLFAVELLS